MLGEIDARQEPLRRFEGNGGILAFQHAFDVGVSIQTEARPEFGKIDAQTENSHAGVCTK